jgi:hypothetical protein
MPRELLAYSLSEHPAPHREKVGLVALFYGLFAAPIVWSGQLMVTYGLVGAACYPGDTPLTGPAPGLGWVWWGVLIADLIALALIASGGLVAYRLWRVTGPPESHHHHLIEVGEGRTRYLAICGMGFAAMFFLLSLTQTAALAWVTLCAR